MNIRKAYFLLIFSLILGKNSAGDLPKNADESGADRGVSWRAYVLKAGDTPKSLFGDNATQSMRFNRLSMKFWKQGVIIKKPDNISLLKDWIPMPLNYEVCGKEKICLSKFKRAIVIDLSQQYLGVYSYGELKKSENKKGEYVAFSVSTGTSAEECKDKKTRMPIGCETPTGLYQVKARYKKRFSHLYGVWMHYAVCIEGGRCLHKGDLPGHPASHGCIRLLGGDAYYLYKRIPAGTYVFVVKVIKL